MEQLEMKIPESPIDLTNDIFNYHSWDEDQKAKGSILLESLKQSYIHILCLVPDCPDRDSALRKLREVRMDCNSAITHRGKY